VRESIDNIRRVAEVARESGLKVGAEFVRNSTFLASLPTALRLHRDAAHPNFGIIFDCYHFWSGPSHFEDMDSIRPGEILHAHLDHPAMPRELLDMQSRVVPGDGVAPLAEILRQARRPPLTGRPAPVGLFLPELQQADPFTLARRIKAQSEAIFKTAGL
jgi:sugar phosphate isomerase/epimerase